MSSSFQHIQSAHCENGVTVSLLKEEDINITEPLAFGMGSGLFYIHIPFLMVNGGPAISFRTMPGAIFSRTTKALGIKIIRKKFRSEEKAMHFLDDKLAEGKILGAQVGVYHLPYFPIEYRFHFNAHNLVVYGKDENNYLISDPIMEEVTTLTADDLQKVRFAKGALAPKGQLYYIDKTASVADLMKPAIIKGIKRNCRDMLRIPGGIAGIKGIGYTARQIPKWREKHGVRKAGLFLAQLIRMQEEIGTGGGGFRYIYAAFLEQSHPYLGKDELLRISEEFTKAGDLWRNNAIEMAKIIKGVNTEMSDYQNIKENLLIIQQQEKKAFEMLDQLKF